MRNLNTDGDAATSPNDLRADKKSVNVKANTFLNFLLGVAAAILVAFVIIELQTPIREHSFAMSSKDDIAIEVNMDKYRIEKPAPKEQPSKPKKVTPSEPIKKVDPNKQPVIIDDEQPDPVQDPQPAAPVEEPTDGKPTSDQPTKNTKPASPDNYNMLSVSEVPLFPGCSAGLDSEERISCLNEKMQRYIQRKFDLSLANATEGKDLVTITVVFTIGIDGRPKDIQVRAPNAVLEKEARRLISGLPEMKPGKYNGAAVNTTYALPIRFKIQ